MLAESQICCAAAWLFITKRAPSSNSSVRMPSARSTSRSPDAESADSSLCSADPARCSNSFSSIARQPFQRFAGQAKHLPLGQPESAEPLVELDRRSVPVEHLPVHPADLFADADACQLDEQPLADALPAEPRPHQQALQLQPP